MNRGKALSFASVPAAVGLAWRQYRKAARAVESHLSVAPDLPGRRHRVRTSWGSVTYRYVEGDQSESPLVMIHGWGKTADTTWWPVVERSDRTMLVVDLPGHGKSELDRPFDLEIAADAVVRAVAEANVASPVIVAHSMGGPVAFHAIRQAGAESFSGLIALSTSAYWVRPRAKALLAMAPYAMSPGSPVVIHREHRELRQSPETASHIAWAYTRRPVRRLLHEASVALRGFDARNWPDLELPPTTWVVAAKDRVLPPAHQRASAARFDADVVEIDVEHSMVTAAPDDVLEVVEGFQPDRS